MQFVRSLARFLCLLLLMFILQISKLTRQMSVKERTCCDLRSRHDYVSRPALAEGVGRSDLVDGLLPIVQMLEG